MTEHGPIDERLEAMSTSLNTARVGFAGTILLSCLVALCITAPAATAAQPPYEPNDNLLTGTGPLGINKTYTAATETSNDKDYYYFYVTTPSSAQVTVTLTDLGGGPSSEGRTSAELEDSHGYEIYGGDLYANRFNYDTFAVTLTAGKYYLEVSSGSYSYGDNYSLATSGTDGAFGEYSTIQARCAAATGPVTTYQSQLSTAEANQKKAEARLRKVRYHGTRRAKRRAIAKYRHARETVAAERASLKAAEKGQKPWCFIPQ